MSTQEADVIAAPIVAYTLFPDTTARAKRFIEAPWGDLVKQVREPSVTWLRKEDCPLFSFCEYGKERTEKRSLRHQANLRRVFGIELDYDAENIPLVMGAQRLRDAGIRAVLYTTASHKRGRCRWRALLPLSAPVAPDARRALVGMANRALGGIIAEESFRLSQSFYIGQVAKVEYEAAEVEGQCIDLVGGLEPLYPEGEETEGAKDETTDTELRAAFPGGSGRYTAMLKLSARWAARGMAEDDIAAALSALLDQSPARNPNTERLRKDATKLAGSATEKFGETRRAVPSKNEAPQATTVVECLADVIERAVEWLTHGVNIPLGKVSLLAGDPGAGKSTVTCDLAAVVSAGQPRAPWAEVLSGEVLMLSAEDDPADTILPRMRTAGADLNRVHVMAAVQDHDDDGNVIKRSFNLTQDVERLGEALQRLGGRVRLIVIDPISAYMGGVDSHVNTDVRGALAPLSELAARHRVAILLVSHLNKSAGGSALYRVTGSLAFTAAARAVYLVTREEEEGDPETGAEGGDTGRRLLLSVKQNLAKESAGFAYSVADHEGVPRIEWEETRVTTTANAALNSNKRKRDDAVDKWLRERLAKGAQPAADMWAHSEHLKFSDNRVKAGLKRLRIAPYYEKREDGKGVWWWALPVPPAKKPGVGPLGDMAPLAPLDPLPAEGAQEEEEDQNFAREGAARGVEVEAQEAQEALGGGGPKLDPLATDPQEAQEAYPPDWDSECGDGCGTEL